MSESEKPSPGKPAARRRILDTLAELYQSTAMALLGGLLLLVFVELALHHFLGGGTSDRLDRFDATAVYAPWVQFRQPDSAGPSLNVEGNRRLTVPGAENPDANAGEAAAMADPAADARRLWMFGGSTVFGWNVADEETLPSQLWGELVERRVEPAFEVSNFGQPYYWSVQEGVLFRSLLLGGEQPPAIAVFVDGLNDVLQEGSSHRVEPFWTPQVASRVEAPSPFATLCRSLHLCRLAHAALARRQAEEVPSSTSSGGEASAARALGAAYDSSYSPPPGVERRELADRLVRTYLRHVETTDAVCRHFEVRCLFVLQPVPFYRYDRSEDPVADQRDFPLFDEVYPRLASVAESNEILLDTTGALEGWEGEAPFVDGFHYTRAFHRHLARRIADRLDLRTPPVESPEADTDTAPNPPSP